MLDTEQGTPAAQDDPFTALLAEAEATEIEPEVPSVDAADPAPATDPATTTDPAPVADAPADPAAPASPEVPLAEVAATTDKPTTDTSFTFKVDGREVTLKGAREEGENIVIPKALWHSEMKNHLADRGAIQRRDNEHRQVVRQLTEQKGESEQTAGAMLTELDRIMQLPEAESFDEWEKFRSGYADRKATAERDYWKNQATAGQETEQQRQHQAEMEQYLPVLNNSLRKFADEALESAKDQLKGITAEDKKELADRLYEILSDDAQAGRIFYKNGEVIPGTTLPRLDVDFQRIAAVVGREVGVVRKTLEKLAAAKASAAKVAAAAKANAEAEAQRKGTSAPPPVSTKAAAAESTGKDKAPASFEDLMESALNS